MIYKNPTYLHPWNLWALAQQLSTGSSLTENGNLPIHYVVSQWNQTPFSLHNFEILFKSYIDPVILLNAIILTIFVSGFFSKRVFKCYKSILPVCELLLTYKVLFGEISNAVSYIDGCSIFDIIIVSFSLTRPLKTKLFASVLPLTKNIYSGDFA